MRIAEYLSLKNKLHSEVVFCTMSRFCLIAFVCLLSHVDSSAQLNHVNIDEYVHDGTIAVLTGMTSYRIYAECESPEDFVTEVTGHPNVCTANISTTTSFYRNNNFSSGIRGEDVNYGLVDITGFEDLRWASYVTIGWNTSATVGVPFSEDSSGEEVLEDDSHSGVNPIGLWTTAFQEGGDILLDSGNGGAWYALNGDVNGYGVGVNNSVLLGQFTTDGDFSCALNISVIPDGASLIAYTNCEDAGTIDNLIYPEAGCTSENTCNYESFADYDDGSCLFCDGGCTDPSACNYDSSAFEDNGTCEYESCLGCTDPIACNYDPSALINDESCLFSDGCLDPLACNYDSQSCDDGICDYSSCYGCTDSSALNYDSSAIMDDNSCLYIECPEDEENYTLCYESNMFFSFTLWGLSAADQVTLAFNSGFMEEGWDFVEFFDGPSNASPSLGIYDGDLAGLIIQSSGNELYVELISDASNSCSSNSSFDEINFDYYCSVLSIPGCYDDLNHCSYNPYSLESCEFIDCFGPVNDLFEDAIDIIVSDYPGCTGISGNNIFASDSFESESNAEDVWYSFETGGQTIYYIEVSPLDNIDLVFRLFDFELNELVYRDHTLTGEIESMTIILEPNEVYHLSVSSWGNGDQGSFEACISGMDDEEAAESDMEILGCTDSEALNYNSLATQNYGSCTYPGIGDFDGDGIVGSSDITEFLGQFGETGDGLSGDLNGDGTVTAADFIIFLGLYGSGG